MKKLFLIPLMTLMTCVMAWGESVHTAGTFDELNTLLTTGAQDGDIIQLTADIAYKPNGSGILNITKSVTIDGQNHTISGYGSRSGNKTTIAINQGGANFVSVTLKDLTIRNAGSSGRPIECRGKMTSLTLNNVKLYATGSGNCQGITIGGNQATAMTLNMTNSLIDVTTRNQAGEITRSGSYAIISFNPYTANIDHCTFYAWAGLYFKGISSSAGSRGSVVNVENTAFHCSNYNSGETNSFGGFVCEDDGITITATNCTMESSALGDQAQAVLLASGDYIASNRRTQPISLTLAGDNTRIIMDGAYYSNIDVKAVKSFDNNTWYKGGITWGSDDYIVPFSVTITGGTYDVNPYYYRHVTAVNRDEYGQPVQTEDGYSVVAQSPIIPEGRAVIEIKEGDKTLYRVTNGSVSYDINESYEEKAEGENPTTSFIVTAEHNEDPAQVQPIELVNNATEAAYVQVRDNEDGDATTLLVGKVENKGEEDEQKVNQTLIVNNGLDVQGESQVLVQSGSALIIGEGGIVTEKPENIVIESTEEEQAVLLLDPTIMVNENPNLTVRLVTNSKQRNATEYIYQRIAIPTLDVATAPANDFAEAGHTLYPGYASFKTYIYYWSGHAWDPITAWSQLQPFVGYQMSNNSSDGGVVYTFQGQLVGNNDGEYEFTSRGFDFFGNSYTAPIQIGKLLDGFNGDVEASVWLYDYEHKNWAIITKDDIEFPEFAFATEIKSMDGFILNLRGANSGVANMSYADAIWDNPRINPNAPSAGAGAPARVAASNIDNSVIINVAAENGVGDRLTLVEKSTNDASFENGSDASKFLNETGVNLYAVTPAGNLSRVATNDLAGTLITFENNESVQFTMTFSAVNGTSYALRDNVTGQIIELVNGGTYSFSQTANTSVAGRFEIVYAPQVTTAIDNIEAKGNVKGIYTVLGQYIGENSMWNTLPAGIYVVDGVKIVK